MKHLFKSVFLVLFLAACSDNIEPNKKLDNDQDKKTLDSKTKTSARRPSGSTDGGIGGNGELGGGGFELTWNGDGRWHGNFGGSPVWFWGPTPTELQNGIQGTWETTCAYYNPGVCYPDGFTVYGNGAGFTVTKPACANINSVIKMPKLVGSGHSFTRSITEQQVSVIAIPGKKENEIKVGLNVTTEYTFYEHYSWEFEDRTLTSFSGGSCSLIATGKVVVNSNCKPMIVSPTSVYPAALCGGGILVE